jgi:hypothetical protein
MPILAATVREFVVAPRQPDWRRLEMRNLQGDDAVQWSGREWIMRRGVLGLDVPPREVISESVPGLDGARLREIRTGPRTVFVPIMMVATDGYNATLRAQLTRLRSFVDYRDVDYGTAEGTFDLAALTPAGGRTLRCTYVEGMEGEYTLDGGTGTYWQSYGVRLLAVDPYWHGDEWSTTEVALPKASPFLSNNIANPFPRALSASVALGADMPVTVGGDVPSPAIVEGTGPWTSMHITSPQGLDVTVGPVGAGHTLLLDTGRQLRCLLDGASDWSLIGDAPQWRPLPPGAASISIEVAGADVNTRARVHGDSLWETAW